MLFLFLIRLQEFEHIRTDKIHPVGKSVSLCVFFRRADRLFRDIGRRYVCSAEVCGIQGKTADMGAGVEHRLPFSQRPQGAAVVFLIEEEAGLLSLLDIDPIADAVFCDFKFCGFREGFAEIKPSPSLFQAFFFPQLRFIALIDAFDGDAVLRKFIDQCAVDDLLLSFHAEGEHFADEDVIVFINR